MFVQRFEPRGGTLQISIIIIVVVVAIIIIIIQIQIQILYSPSFTTRKVSRKR